MSSLSTFFLVFEFCEHDLAGLLSNVNVKFNLGEIKKVMFIFLFIESGIVSGYLMFIFKLDL